MARVWLIEREIWFSQIYGQVVHGSPWLAFSYVNKSYFPIVIYENLYYYHVDIMTDFLWSLF